MKEETETVLEQTYDEIEEQEDFNEADNPTADNALDKVKIRHMLSHQEHENIYNYTNFYGIIITVIITTKINYTLIKIGKY